MTRTQAATPKSRSAWPRRLALALVLLAILLLVRLIFHSRVPDGPLTNPAVAASQTPVAVKFDFYTVLPKMAVSSPAPPPDSVLPKSDPVLPKVAKSPVVASPPISAMSTPAPQPRQQSSSEMYVLQLAAVRNLTEAERLCDDLRRRGAPAFIQSYRAGEIVWYRVMMGPYASQDLARRQQDRLKDHHINAILLKRPQ